jgi:hypothetical protein
MRAAAQQAGQPAASERHRHAGPRTAGEVGVVEGLQAAAHLLRHLALLLQSLLLERQLLLEGTLQEQQAGQACCQPSCR